MLVGRVVGRVVGVGVLAGRVVSRVVGGAVDVYAGETVAPIVVVALPDTEADADGVRPVWPPVVPGPDVVGSPLAEVGPVVGDEVSETVAAEQEVRGPPVDPAAVDVCDVSEEPAADEAAVVGPAAVEGNSLQAVSSSSMASKTGRPGLNPAGWLQ